MKRISFLLLEGKLLEMERERCSHCSTIRDALRDKKQPVCFLSSFSTLRRMNSSWISVQRLDRKPPMLQNVWRQVALLLPTSRFQDASTCLQAIEGAFHFTTSSSRNTMVVMSDAFRNQASMPSLLTFHVREVLRLARTRTCGGVGHRKVVERCFSCKSISLREVHNCFDRVD